MSPAIINSYWFTSVMNSLRTVIFVIATTISQIPVFHSQHGLFFGVRDAMRLWTLIWLFFNLSWVGKVLSWHHLGERSSSRLWCSTHWQSGQMLVLKYETCVCKYSERVFRLYSFSYLVDSNHIDDYNAQFAYYSRQYCNVRYEKILIPLYCFKMNILLFGWVLFIDIQYVEYYQCLQISSKSSKLSLYKYHCHKAFFFHSAITKSKRTIEQWPGLCMMSFV